MVKKFTNKTCSKHLLETWYTWRKKARQQILCWTINMQMTQTLLKLIHKVQALSKETLAELFTALNTLDYMGEGSANSIYMGQSILPRWVWCISTWEHFSAFVSLRHPTNQEWWCIPGIAIFRRLRQEDGKFEARLAYTANSRTVWAIHTEEKQTFMYICIYVYMYVTYICVCKWRFYLKFKTCIYRLKIVNGGSL